MAEKNQDHNSINLESKYNILQNTSITGKFTFNNINYKCAKRSTATTVSYIMLDGLLPGKNFLWSLSINQTIAE